MSRQVTLPFVSEQPRIGVVATLTRAESGRVRLTLDDVDHQPSVGTILWSHKQLFTHKDFDADSPCSMHLSKEDLALIGENLLIRLVAQLEGKYQSRGYEST